MPKINTSSNPNLISDYIFSFSPSSKQLRIKKNNSSWHTGPELIDMNELEAAYLAQQHKKANKIFTNLLRTTADGVECLGTYGSHVKHLANLVTKSPIEPKLNDNGHPKNDKFFSLPILNSILTTKLKQVKTVSIILDIDMLKKAPLDDSTVEYLQIQYSNMLNRSYDDAKRGWILRPYQYTLAKQSIDECVLKHFNFKSSWKILPEIITGGIYQRPASIYEGLHKDNKNDYNKYKEDIKEKWMLIDSYFTNKLQPKSIQEKATNCLKWLGENY